MQVFNKKNEDGSIWRVCLRPTGDEVVVLSADGLEQLATILAQADMATACRAIVLQGVQGSFCEGMDLQGVADAEQDARLESSLRCYASCLARLRGCTKPVIALVDGAVIAGGLGLAAAADVVIATERALFGLPELMLGLVPAMVLPLLLERVPPQKARRLALCSASIDARQALDLGLVDRLVGDEADLERALRGELRLLLRAAPDAIVALKRFIEQVRTLEPTEAVEAGCRLTAERLRREETVETIRAFIDGAPLPWHKPPRNRPAERP